MKFFCTNIVLLQSITQATILPHFFSDSKRSFLIYFSQISCLIPMIFLKIQARFLLYTAYILIKTCGPLLFQSNQYQVFYLKEYHRQRSGRDDRTRVDKFWMMVAYHTNPSANYEASSICVSYLLIVELCEIFNVD